MSVWQIAIETSARQGSVALLRQDISIKEVVLDSQTRTAQSIGPAIEALVSMLANEGHPLGFVSVTSGPGSFTGLRIGVTAAKALAFTRNCPVVACDTLAVMIQQVRNAYSSSSEQPLCLPAIGSSQANSLDIQQPTLVDAALNAYRGQVFCRRETLDGSWQGDSEVRDTDAWLNEILKIAMQNSTRSPFATEPFATEPFQTESGSQSQISILATGDAWNQRPPVHPNVQIVDSQLWQPTASELGKMAWQLFTQSQFQDCLTLVPNYLRESAAIEKRNSELKNFN